MGDVLVFTESGNLGGTVGTFSPAQVTITVTALGESAGKVNLTATYGVGSVRAGYNPVDGSWTATGGLGRSFDLPVGEGVKGQIYGGIGASDKGIVVEGVLAVRYGPFWSGPNVTKSGVVTNVGGAVSVVILSWSDLQRLNSAITEPLANVNVPLSQQEWFDGLTYGSNPVFGTTEPKCFTAGTEISMADGSTKPIEEIRPDDWVMSFDQKSGEMKPGKVTRTFTNEAKIILDFHGTFVTPGHVYYCAGGKYEGRFVPLIDILRDDGVIQHEDGTLIRAATGCEVGSADDKAFWAYTAYEDADGTECIKDGKLLRLGTRWMLPNGHHFTMREFFEGNRIELLEDGRVHFKDKGVTTPFIWTFSDAIPNPEDFVLSRSQTSLEDIYEAGQWEAVEPTMPVPLRRDSGPIQPVSEFQLDAMPRNMPMAFENESPSSSLAPNRPRMNRRQRKAQEAKMRASAKKATVH